MSSQRLLSWILLASVLAQYGSNEVIKMSSWTFQKGQQMTGHELALDARSRIDCIRSCRQFSHCISLIFDKASRKCYLHPSTVPATSGNGLTVYINKVPDCSPSEILTIGNSTNVTWQRTLTSLIANVTCISNFMWSGNFSGPRCWAKELWDLGECLQHKWENAEVGQYRIPLPVIEGWTLCLEGFPTSSWRFTIDLLTNIQDIALQIDVRFQAMSIANTTLLTQRFNGVFTPSQSVTDFPFVVGQAFSMKVKYAGNATFELFFNGQPYATSSQTLPFTPIKNVSVRNNVSVTLLDVWCTP